MIWYSELIARYSLWRSVRSQKLINSNCTWGCLKIHGRASNSTIIRYGALLQRRDSEYRPNCALPTLFCTTATPSPRLVAILYCYSMFCKVFKLQIISNTIRSITFSILDNIYCIDSIRISKLIHGGNFFFPYNTLKTYFHLCLKIGLESENR